MALLHCRQVLFPEMFALIQRKRFAPTVAPVLVLLLLFAAAKAAVSVSWGSEHVTRAGDYTIENWQVEEGLPQISVTSIAQTPDGYLWLGTFNGLARFDGVRFTVFDEANSPALGGSSILRLITDCQGGLWIMTQEGGLARLADGRFTAYGPERGLPACGAAALVVDLEERLLVVDRNGGLHRIEDGQLVTPEREDHLGGTEPRLLVAPSEPCWVDQQGKATHARLVPLLLRRTDGNDPPQVELRVPCATRSREGGFWLAATSGVYRLQNGCLQGPPTAFPQPMKSVVAMADDGLGNLWVGCWANGLFRKDSTGQWQQFTVGAGLAEHDVASLFVDRESNVWVGTFSGGLHRFKLRVFRTYDSRDGLAGNTVMSVTEDRRGRLWMGINGGGLNCWEEGRFAPVTTPSEIRGYGLAYCVLADRQDAIWVGLYGEKALRLHAGALTPYHLGAGSSEPLTPRALFEDRAGTIWLGCTQGLLRHDAGQFRRYTTQDGLTHDDVRALAEDRNGTLFVGTHGGGLNCLSSNRFSCFTARDGLPEKHIAALWMDPDGALWIGTVYGGLSRYYQGRFASITTRDGLPSNAIGTILEDDTRNLWLGSKRGIVRVNRPELNSYLDGQPSALTWRVFNGSDGLNSIECTGGGQPASCKTRDGRLWFATVKGLAVVEPRQLPFNSIPPPVVIEEVLVDEVLVASNVNDRGLESIGQPPLAATLSNAPRSTVDSSGTFRASRIGARSTERLLVPPRKNRIEFRYTAPSLISPDKVRFRYRLNGLDRDWIQGGSQRSASYDRVLPGAYRFEVTACNNDGVWNATGATLGLVVLPPWWMTWWFRALAGIGVAGIVFGWYEHRLHRLRRQRQAQESFSRRLIASQESERQRLAGELHDGLGQDLLVIASQAQLSLGQPGNSPTTTARLQEITDTAKQAIQQARRMAHNLRPGLLEELGLTKAIRANADRAAHASGISMAVALEDVDGLLPPEFEVNLFRISQEGLNNVLKHANASKVEITLTKQPISLCLLVEDNGRGFEPGRLESAPPDQRGFGLHQIAERAKMMGGRLDLQSRPGKGTRLIVEVPLQGSRFRP